MRFFKYSVIMLALPFCASSAWKEGFTSPDSLQLVGEGYAKSDLPQVQAMAMAREAAVMEAMSHWPRFCGERDATEFRVENQKKRSFECESGTCRARIVIEKADLRRSCGS